MKANVKSLLVSASLVTGMLTGSIQTPAQEAGNETVTSYGTYTEEDPYQLTFAYIEFYSQDEAATQAVEDAMNEYMIPNYHIQVDFLPLEYSSYTTAIQLMMSGGDPLDVIPIYYPNASGWISMGGVMDMTEYMETEEGQAIIDALGEANAYVGRSGDFLYGFPSAKESVDIGGLCMRADICDELGLTEKYGLGKNVDTYTGTIYSWDVAEEIFAAVKEAHPEITPLYIQGNGPQTRYFVQIDELADQFGTLNYVYDPESTTIVNEFETDAYKDYVQRMARWYDAGYIYKDAATDTQGSAAMMKAGNTFSYVTSIKPGFLVEAEAANGCDCYAMFFGNTIGGAYTTTNVSFFNTGIAANSMDPEMAFRFISALYTDPAVMNFWQYGIEGVNYQVLDDGTAFFVEGEDAANYAYHQNTGWCQGNQFISYVWNDGSKDPGYWDQLKKHNRWGLYSPAFGFMWDSSDYSTEMTALSNALATYKPTLETGSAGVEGVEEILEKLNEALYSCGLQDVMDEKQAQFDAWAEENGLTRTPEENLEQIASVTTGILTE